jgi:hypothetical protein
MVAGMSSTAVTPSAARVCRAPDAETIRPRHFCASATCCGMPSRTQGFVCLDVWWTQLPVSRTALPMLRRRHWLPDDPPTTPEPRAPLRFGNSTQRDQRPSTTSIPARTRSSFLAGSRPVRSVRSARSRVTTWDTLATDGLDKPVARSSRDTFPGAFDQRRLLVSGTHTTVLMRLRLSASPWTTITGRRNPGSEPCGSGTSAHHTSPWLTLTSYCAAARDATLQ